MRKVLFLGLILIYNLTLMLIPPLPGTKILLQKSLPQPQRLTRQNSLDAPKIVYGYRIEPGQTLRRVRKIDEDARERRDLPMLVANGAADYLAGRPVELGDVGVLQDAHGVPGALDLKMVRRDAGEAEERRTNDVWMRSGHGWSSTFSSDAPGTSSMRTPYTS